MYLLDGGSELFCDAGVINCRWRRNRGQTRRGGPLARRLALCSITPSTGVTCGDSGHVQRLTVRTGRADSVSVLTQCFRVGRRPAFNPPGSTAGRYFIVSFNVEPLVGYTRLLVSGGSTGANRACLLVACGCTRRLGSCLPGDWTVGHPSPALEQGGARSRWALPAAGPQLQSRLLERGD